MSTELSIGDRVRLNSGGPLMTVTEIETDTDTMAGEATIYCQRFGASDVKKSDRFHPKTLTKIGG
jgi:uncharacterized protein YodC (DUF2158 family)